MLSGIPLGCGSLADGSVIRAWFVFGAGVLDLSRAEGILANTAAPSVCITSDLPVTRAFQETSRFSGRHELISPNRVVRNCELLIGLRLFLGKIDHDDLRVFA